MDLPSFGESVVYLQPRPLALASGKLLLLPLLPRRRPFRPLPCELWTEIFELVLSAYDDQELHYCYDARLGLLLICRALKVRVNLI